MTDAEIIASWMEPLDSVYSRCCGGWTPQYWWSRDQPLCNVLGRDDPPYGEWHPAPLTLDRLRLVESKLTEGQRGCYLDAICYQGAITEFGLLHASAEAKIAALAAVLKETK